MYVFDLPVDVAVKQFKDMNEAFWLLQKRPINPYPISNNQKQICGLNLLSECDTMTKKENYYAGDRDLY